MPTDELLHTCNGLLFNWLSVRERRHESCDPWCDEADYGCDAPMGDELYVISGVRGFGLTETYRYDGTDGCPRCDEADYPVSELEPWRGQTTVFSI